MNDPKKVLFEKILKLWEEGENQSSIINDLYEYYAGTNYKNPADSFFLKENRTPLNVIGQIIDAKHSAVLDAQFNASVVPDIYNFSDMQAIKALQNVANVLNKGLQQVLKKNCEDDIKERALKWGFIKRGATQVIWDTTNNTDGDIKISVVDPRNLRYTKGAQSVDELTMVAYSVDIDAAIVKRDYARMPDGSFDIELCKRIDEAVGNKDLSKDKGNDKAIAPYQTDNSAGLAYVKDSQAQSAGKILTIVVMFLFDGTLEAPVEGQTPEDVELQNEMKLKYPNGRLIMFVPNKEKQLILKDEAAPESFKSLGNIDFLLLNKFSGLDVKSEVDNLIGGQDRINGTIRKLRATVGGNINSVLFDERHRGIVEDNAFVNLPVVFIDGLGDFQPPVLNNGGIEQAMKLRELIESYKNDMYEIARINRAWVSGENQDNVKSGDHADALNESAMSAIRSLQRNFKDYWIGVCEKVISLMLENYTTQRLIEIGSGVTAQEYAMFDTEIGEDGQPQKTIKFIDEAGKIADMIKIDPAWKFKIEVTSGTDIPRSRLENSRLVDEVIASPIMQTGDIDMIDMYLTAKDFPNRHAVVEMLKKKMEQKAKNPEPILEQLGKNPDMMKAWSDLFKALEGHPNAQGQLLERAGLNPETGTITSLPANLVTSRSQAKDIALIAPAQVSENPKQAKFGHDQATDVEIITHAEKQNQHKFVPEEAK